jgi:hypothetical protein
MMSGLYPTTPLFEAVNVSSVECVKLLVEVFYIYLSLFMSSLALGSLHHFNKFSTIEFGNA